MGQRRWVGADPNDVAHPSAVPQHDATLIAGFEPLEELVLGRLYPVALLVLPSREEKEFAVLELETAAGFSEPAFSQQDNLPPARQSLDHHRPFLESHPHPLSSEQIRNGAELSRVTATMNLQSITRFAVAVGLSAGIALAQGPHRGRAAQSLSQQAARAEHFPLAAGNWWVYETRTQWFDGEKTVRVVEDVDIDGLTYHRVEGLANEPVLLRANGRGQIVARVGSDDELWYDFAAPAGGGWATGRDECAERASVSSRTERVETPAGVFAPALRVRYAPGFCADAGLEEEDFAQGVGLVRWSEQTIAGPRVFVLREAFVGGRATASPGVSFTLSIEQPVYTPNMMPPIASDSGAITLKARLTVENSTDSPLVLRFPSGQTTDLVVRNSDGREIYVWSANKLFPAIVTEIELSSGRRSFYLTAVLSDPNGGPLKPGLYTAEAWLPTDEPRSFSASVGFEVTEPAF